MNKEILISKLVSNKADNNNTIDLDAYARGLDDMYEEITDVSGSYYISNMDNQIHNSNDRLHNIIEHDTWTEISIIDSDGCEIESCCLYKTLKDLLVAISH
jgi:hypothetical protein